MNSGPVLLQRAGYRLKFFPITAVDDDVSTRARQTMSDSKADTLTGTGYKGAATFEVE